MSRAAHTFAETAFLRAQLLRAAMLLLDSDSPASRAKGRDVIGDAITDLEELGDAHRFEMLQNKEHGP